MCRYSELDRQAREKTLCLQAAKEVIIMPLNLSAYIMYITTQRWVEREAELECQVREVEEECVRVERERREERESVAEQLKKNDLLIERYFIEDILPSVMTSCTDLRVSCRSEGGGRQRGRGRWSSSRLTHTHSWSTRERKLQHCKQPLTQ